MKSKVYIIIGEKIKKSRDELGISQKQLAEHLGFDSPTAISLIESGERRIAVAQLEKAAKFLRKDIKYFLGAEDKQDIRIALRADKNLTPKDEESILTFIEFVKKQKSGK